MSTRPKFESHEEYFAAAAPEAQGFLRHIQASVQDAVPNAVPCISYGMPAFRRSKVFFYFAAFKKHIGIYPPVNGSAQLQVRLAKYRGPKGNLSFPLAESMPYELIREVAVQLAEEYASSGSKPRKRSAA